MTYTFRWVLAAAAASALVAGCGPGAPGAVESADQVGPTAPQRPSTLDGLQPASPLRGPLRAPDSGYSVSTTDRDQVRLFYKTVFNSSEAVSTGWSGALDSCNAGDTSAESKASVLRRVNWYRAMAGLPANITLDAGFNAKAQQAALMMAANNSLNHFPPTTWRCYTAVGSEAAGKSNLSLGSFGSDAVMGQMRDAGANNTIVGHRRWILYPQTQVMGTGSVEGATSASALWVFDSNLSGPRPAVRDDFVAWPPKGYVPYQAVYPRWSFSYPGANFGSATVTMTQGGVPVPVRMEAVQNGFGENTVVWIPNGLADGDEWARPAADTTYRVTVANVVVGSGSRTFTYDVTVIDPDAGAAVVPAVSGPSSATVGQAAVFSLTAAGGANGYQWRTLSTAPYSQVVTAASGTSNFTVSTSSGYSVVASGVPGATGAAFRLEHPQPTDQTLRLNELLYVKPGATLSFKSRLGFSGTGESALVEISADGGLSWATLDEQRGNSGVSGFARRSASLDAFAGRVVQVRFRYAFKSGGTYFAPQGTFSTGWYLDDIRFDGVDRATVVSGPSDAAGLQFSYTPPAAGAALLQARAGLYGYFGDWSNTQLVTAAVAAASAATPGQPADCLFAWAERTYAPVLPAGGNSITVGPWYFRFYPSSGWYVGINGGNDHLYYMAPGGGPVDLGDKGGWFANAGCR